MPQNFNDDFKTTEFHFTFSKRIQCLSILFWYTHGILYCCLFLSQKVRHTFSFTLIEVREIFIYRSGFVLEWTVLHKFSRKSKTKYSRIFQSIRLFWKECNYVPIQSDTMWLVNFFSKIWNLKWWMQKLVVGSHELLTSFLKLKCLILQNPRNEKKYINGNTFIYRSVNLKSKF